MSDQLENNLIYDLAASALFGKTGTLCFAARGSGLYRSEDGGRSWQDAYRTLVTGPSLPTTSLAFSPNFEHDHQIFAGVPGGVVRSSDGGLNWRTAVFPPPAPLVVSLVVSPNFADDDTLFAGTAEDGVFISTDGGVSWTAWNFGLLDMNMLCLAISPDFARDETLYAGTTTGLFISTNGGRAWRELELPADLAVVLSLAVSPNFAADRTVFAGTEENGLLRGSAGTDQAGMRWEQLGGSSQGEPINAILLAPGYPEPPELLLLQGSQLYISTNQGETILPWLPPALPADFEITAVAAPHGFSSGAPVLVGGSGGEVLVV